MTDLNNVSFVVVRCLDRKNHFLKTSRYSYSRRYLSNVCGDYFGELCCPSALLGWPLHSSTGCKNSSHSTKHEYHLDSAYTLICWHLSNDLVRTTVSCVRFSGQPYNASRHSSRCGEARQAHITNRTSQNHIVGIECCREAFFHSISCLHTEMCQSKVVLRSAMRSAKRPRGTAGVRVTIVFK